jgi:hypothetical protein
VAGPYFAKAYIDKVYIAEYNIKTNNLNILVNLTIIQLKILLRLETSQLPSKKPFRIASLKGLFLF